MQSPCLILIVDDSPADVVLAKRLFSKIWPNVEYVVARTIASGQVLLQSRPDLVVCDLRLPDGNGAVLADRAAREGIHAVVMTGSPALARIFDGESPIIPKGSRADYILDELALYDADRASAMAAVI